MRLPFYCLIMLFLLGSCADSSEHELNDERPIAPSRISDTSENQVPTLTFLWETDSLLTTVESVAYDPDSQFIYTANIEGDFMEKDGQGSISKINLDGEIMEVGWVTGLDAPTGLSISNGTLYTTDIDRLIKIDVATAEILEVIPIEGATALNDVTIAPEETVYASDTGGNTIFKLKDGTVSPFVQDIDTPNGLVYNQNTLLISQWTPEILQTYDVQSQSLTHIAGGLPQADGIEILDDQGYLVSSWGGRVFFVDHEGTTTKILDTSSEGINAADVSVVSDKGIVFVATFSNNTVMAYELN